MLFDQCLNNIKWVHTRRNICTQFQELNHFEKTTIMTSWRPFLIFFENENTCSIKSLRTSICTYISNFTTTDGIGVLNIRRSGWSGLDILFDITMDSLFEGLNVTNHFFAHSDMVAIFWFRIDAPFIKSGRNLEYRTDDCFG